MQLFLLCDAVLSYLDTYPYAHTIEVLNRALPEETPDDLEKAVAVLVGDGYLRLGTPSIPATKQNDNRFIITSDGQAFRLKSSYTIEAEKRRKTELVNDARDKRIVWDYKTRYVPYIMSLIALMISIASYLNSCKAIRLTRQETASTKEVETKNFYHPTEYPYQVHISSGFLRKER